MQHTTRRFILTTFLVACGLFVSARGEERKPASGVAPFRVSPSKSGELELYVPEPFGGVPKGNDYNDPASDFNFERSRSSPHFHMFWAKDYGVDPKANSDKSKRFSPEEVLAASEKSYEIFLKQLDWAPAKDAFVRRFKVLILVREDPNGTAYGGKACKEVGAFWTPASRIRSGPYGVIAHELGHSFQGLTRSDGAQGFADNSMIAEMTSQFMLWNVYPDWQIFENYHLNDFMKATHLAFLHPDNRYHSCYPLEYWAFRHGPSIIGKIWREVKEGEDPVMTYKRVTKIDQARFNDEMFDGCRRFVTWDLPRIEKVAARYADQHFTRLDPGPDGWFGCTTELAPQNYGYNAIKLQVPAAGTKVKVAFRGKAGAPGFKQERVDKAGWRYGFLVHRGNGERVYSPIYSQTEGMGEITVPEDAKFLWLVVMGAPTEHALATRKDMKGEQLPYMFKLQGTAPDVSIVKE